MAWWSLGASIGEGGQAARWNDLPQLLALVGRCIGDVLMELVVSHQIRSCGVRDQGGKDRAGSGWGGTRNVEPRTLIEPGGRMLDELGIVRELVCLQCRQQLLGRRAEVRVSVLAGDDGHVRLLG